jgi:hypothetical protein
VVWYVTPQEENVLGSRKAYTETGMGNCISGRCDTKLGGQTTNGKCGPLFLGNKTCVGSEFGEW